MADNNGSIATDQILDVQIQRLICHEEVQHVIVLTLDGNKGSTELPVLYVQSCHHY